jgi:hypothetical protein
MMLSKFNRLFRAEWKNVINDELEMKWMDEDVTYHGINLGICLEKMRKNTDTSVRVGACGPRIDPWTM